MRMRLSGKLKRLDDLRSQLVAARPGGERRQGGWVQIPSLFSLAM